MRQFKKVFGRLPDPRAANARHDLLEVLVIALAATLCGAESCSDMADFGAAKEELLRLFLRLEHGIPSHDTFSRVFRLLKPQAFEKVFRRFMAAFAKANGLKLTGVVAVDGKALRGAYERGGKATPLHLVNVFAVDARMALAQQKAPGRNETAGALEVLDLLSLEGCIVTADALHCSRAFASAVLERGGNYTLAIKANRGPLFKAVTQQFARSGRRSSAEQIDPSSHDRHEARRATIMRNTSLAAHHDFPGVAAVGRITSRRRLRGHRADAPVVRHYLLSKYISPKRLLHITRSHWGIENQLHWVLDVHFAEDGNRARKDHAPENLATLRRLALNILRAHPDRASIRRKIKRAGWDHAFFLGMLGHMR
ncbi:transposase [Bradyrhizobium macuxiense]|uniref:Transposase n=1 Tax=Bradyrhizobium macuxiense TaxID=1755647 RepID=A0A109JNW4_9BRAD|nr:ISAs1 family transposase [Bradyrhizobium macuxiense]KWV44458.1 transposase [Bradyrhizobium macuxiense]KWV52538.1 transposase [Bradyrhizobium macuxiense]KWV52811.1 transposase [Bradyrhizobium macuxiense]KWV53033.1 transposase [Bradyrhizobium macuxiense]KWV53181.1 transposase [Bradyrhizobium macuxiense]